MVSYYNGGGGGRGDNDDYGKDNDDDLQLFPRGYIGYIYSRARKPSQVTRPFDIYRIGWRVGKHMRILLGKNIIFMIY